jgi:hypothetical protein
MDDATDKYDEFLGVLQELVEEVEEAEEIEEIAEIEGDLGGPAAEFGPRADGVVAELARAHAKDPDEKALMENMKLDELLSYLGEKGKDADVIAASRAAARILAILRWFHYGSFARHDHEERLDWEEQATLLRAGLDRLYEPIHDGGNTHG